MRNYKILKYKWTVSKGQYTYGYTICTLYVNGEKVSSCKGGGYDMAGVCLAEFIMYNLQSELKKKRKEILKLYGVKENSKGDIYLDGVTGFSCMIKVLNVLDYSIHLQDYKNDIYILEDKSLREFEESALRIAIKRSKIVKNKALGLEYIENWAKKMKDYNPQKQLIIEKLMAATI